MELGALQPILGAYCQSRGIRKMSVFGSAARDLYGPHGDLDLLIEIEPGRVVGYLDLAEMQIELSEMTGREVDLRTPAELSRYIREQVLREAKPIYVR